MFHLVKFSFLSIVCMASTALASAATLAPAPDWDVFVKESLQSRSTVQYFSVQYPSCSTYCPEGWVTYSRRCFIYVAQSMKWVSAENYCLNLGANLVSIHNEDEYQLVRALIRAHDPQQNPTWMGLTGCQEKYNWIWSDGSKFNYTNWSPKEPNSLNGECCVHMNWSDQKKWNDIPCALNYPFVCAKKLN